MQVNKLTTQVKLHSQQRRGLAIEVVNKLKFGNILNDPKRIVISSGGS